MTAAEGMKGSLSARNRTKRYRVQQLRPPSHISVILGAVAAKLWLAGSDRIGYDPVKGIEDSNRIDRKLTKFYNKHKANRRFVPHEAAK